MKNKTRRIVAGVFLVAAVVVCVFAYIVLPDTVATQFSLGGSEYATLPRIMAVFLPFVIGAGGAVYALWYKGNDGEGTKSLVLSGIGIAVVVLMLLVNLL